MDDRRRRRRARAARSAAGSACRGGAGRARGRRRPSCTSAGRRGRRAPRRPAPRAGAARSRSPARATRAGTAAVPWWTVTARRRLRRAPRARRRAGSSTGYAPGVDEHVAAAERVALDRPAGDRDPLARLGPLDRRVVHLHAAHAHLEPARLGAEHVALADRARPERAGDDGADPAQREDPVDVEPRRRRRAAPARRGRRRARARRAARRGPRRSSR